MGWSITYSRQSSNDLGYGTEPTDSLPFQEFRVARVPLLDVWQFPQENQLIKASEIVWSSLTAFLNLNGIEAVKRKSFIALA